VALHPIVPSTPVSDGRPRPGRKPFRVAALLLAASLTLGAVAIHPHLMPTFAPASTVADGGIHTNGGPCWGCGT
jgi:hypothetical protein